MLTTVCDVILQVPEVPGSLAGNSTWNCSVPHWPRFQRHFRCNLRQECAGGEDEVRCPYSPCRHGGVSFAGHCYFFLTDVNVVWSAAHDECRKFGAYMVSLTSPREWSDVMSWLHLGVPWLKKNMLMVVYVGLAPALSSVPFM